MLPKQLSSPKKDAPLYKKRNLDFTDYAYREAVNRLKYLLADSYTATKRNSICHRHDDSDDTDNVSIKTVERPVLSEISKYLPASRYNSLKKYTGGYSAYTNQSPGAKSNVNSSLLQVPYTHATHLPTASPSSHGPTTLADTNRPPPEILNFIEKQEGYIEQLERESQFCRDELNNLLTKVKDVISENETLTDQAKGGVSRSVFPESSESDGVEPDYNYSVKPKAKVQLHGPNIVFESRISELEAQLAQSSIDFKRLLEENEANKRKIAYGSSDIGGGAGDVYKKQIENLQRDKQTLEDTVRKLQHSLDDLKATDANNFTRTQRNRDLAEQSAFEKAQADIEIKRLKDELERQHVRVREIQHEMAKKIAEERAIAERRYNYQVDQLGGDLTSQWEVASRLQLELERHKRMDVDNRRDLAQKNAQIDEIKNELKAKTASLLSDVAQVNAEKQSLEQEITSLRLQLERADRQSKVETSRLNAEIVSLRQRLDRSDSDLLHSRRENLRLGDQISSLEKDLALGDLNREPRPSKEIQKLMADMEAKHVATVSELEGMVQGQRQLMEKLTAECKTLTKRLEDTTHKHKLEKDNLRTTNTELMDRLKRIWTSYKEVLPSTSHCYSSDSDQINDKHLSHNHRSDKKSQSTDESHQSSNHDATVHSKMNRSDSRNEIQPLATTICPQNMSNNRRATETNTRKTALPLRSKSLDHRSSTITAKLTSNENLPYQAHSLLYQNSHQQQPMNHSTQPVCAKTLFNSTSNQLSIMHQELMKPLQTVQQTNNYMTQTMQPRSNVNMMNNQSMTSSHTNTHNSRTNKPTMPERMTNNSTTSSNMIHSNNMILNMIPPISNTNNIQQITTQITQTKQHTNPNNSNPSSTHPHHSQGTLNQLRAAELWGKTTPELESSQRHQQPDNSLNYCRNSLPRRNPLIPMADEIIPDVPAISISSPSLFEDSSDSSPTLSPANTVQKLF
ncbi:uncharacterized protein DDB_G0283697-like isoform X3 [Bradysia coprophila]|uniref:uncharacterized protein DDB_G0283697-like isoform X3 n=1 Tax=Bradysia coprophila TaxID=38358 RepID=UPI00187D8D7F|nr:uncharacterized protein DDB_G0283697-like isoform X3 [Bradysia coprophila]